MLSKYPGKVFGAGKTYPPRYLLDRNIIIHLDHGCSPNQLDHNQENPWGKLEPVFKPLVELRSPDI
jgi:hypothetical protein